MSIYALGNCDTGNSTLLPPDCTQVLSKYMSKDERRNCLELPEGSNALFEAKELCPQGCPDSTTQKIVREFAAKVKRAFSEKKAADVEAVQKKRLKESLHHLHSEVLLKQKNPEKKELTKLISAIQLKMLDEKTAPTKDRAPNALFTEEVPHFLQICDTKFQQKAQIICDEIQEKLAAPVTDQERTELVTTSSGQLAFLEVELDANETQNLAELHEVPDDYFQGASIEEVSAEIDSLIHYAPDIRRMSFKGMTTLSPEIIKKLSGFKNLCDVSFENTHVTDQELAELHNIPKLTRCNLKCGLSDRNRMTDKGLAFLPDTLEEIDVSGRQALTPQGFTTLFTRLKQLRTCDVSYTLITYGGLISLPETLENLSMRCGEFSLTENEALSLFARLKGLKQIELNGRTLPNATFQHLPSTIEDFSCYGCSESFTSTELGVALKRLSKLKKCWLSFLPINDQTLASLPNDLEELSGWSRACGLTTEGAATFLARAKKLKVFGFTSLGIAKAPTFSALTDTLERLHYLYFSDRTEEELIDLFTRLKKLKIAYLDYAQITEAVIASFPPSLEELSVIFTTDNKHSKEEKRALLQSRLPHLRIT